MSFVLVQIRQHFFIDKFVITNLILKTVLIFSKGFELISDRSELCKEEYECGDRSLSRNNGNHCSSKMWSYIKIRISSRGRQEELPLPHSTFHWSSPADPTAASEAAWEDNRICEIADSNCDSKHCFKQSPSQFGALLVQLWGWGSHMNPEPLRYSLNEVMRIQGRYRWKEIPCLSKSTEKVLTSHLLPFRN